MLKHTPIGTNAWRYTFISNLVVVSMRSVVRVKILVAIVAQSMCHVVSVIEKGNRSRIHLLKMITTEERTIHILFQMSVAFPIARASEAYKMEIIPLNLSRFDPGGAILTDRCRISSRSVWNARKSMLKILASSLGCCWLGRRGRTMSRQGRSRANWSCDNWIPLIRKDGYWSTHVDHWGRNRALQGGYARYPPSRRGAWCHSKASEKL